MAKILLNVQLETESAKKQIDAIKSSFNELTKSLGSMTPNKDLTAQLNALAKAYGALTKSANAQLTADKERAALEAKLAKLEADTAKSEAQRAAAVSKVAQEAEKAAQQIEKTRAATEKANAEAAKASTAQEKLAQAHEKTEQEAAKTLLMEEKLFGQTGKNTEETEKYGQSVETLGMKFGNLIERYAKFYASSLLVRKPLEMIKSALDDVSETLVKTEDAVIELQRVLDGTIPQSKEISDALYDLAYKYGQTFENASTLAANFARSGKTWTESLEATEAALLAMNVAELNATSASDGLLSIIQQFGMETGELLNIVDKLNKVADKNPVTTGKLLEAIKRSGSAAKNANISFDETLALITSISEATNRSGQNIGTAINSLIQYSSKNVDVFAKLSDEANEAVKRFKIGAASIAEVWKQVAEDIHNDKTMRDALLDSLGTDGMEELASTLHDELGDLVSEIDGVYNVANTYRKNYFVALLDNMFDTESELGRFSKVLEDLQDVQDYSHKENDRYMETYTAKVNQLQAAWQKLANDEQGFLGFKKAITEIGIEIVNLVDEGGGLINVLIRVGGIAAGLMITLNAAKLADGWNNFTKSVNSTITAMARLGGAATAAQAAFGWIGVAVAAFSALISAVRSYNREQEQLRDETISNWRETRNQIDQIETLLEKLNTLNEDSEEYRDVESKINELLGDKKILLRDAAEGTAEYAKAVEGLVEKLEQQNKAEALAARTAAEEKFIGAAKQALVDTAKAGYDGNVLGKWFYGLGAEWGASSVDSMQEATQTLITLNNRLKEAENELFAAEESGNRERIVAVSEYYAEIKKIRDALQAERDSYSEIFNATDRIIKGASDSAQYIEAGMRGVADSAKEASGALGEVADAASKAGVSPRSTAELWTEIAEKTEKQAKALETVAKAQKEYNESGAVSASTLKNLLGLGDDWVKAMFDEQQQLDLNSEAVANLAKETENELAKYGILIPGLEELTGTREKVRAATEKEIAALQKNVGEKEKAIQATQNQIAIGKEFKTNIETVNAAQKELEHTGKLSIETQEKLLGLKKNLVRAMIDEDGNIDVNSDKVQQLIGKWRDYCKQLGIAIEDTYELGKATDKTLENIQNEISLWKSKLSISEKDGSSLQAREDQMRVIIALLDNEIQRLQSTRDLAEDKRKVDEEINKLKAEQLDYEAKIQKMYDDAAKEQAKLIEEQQKAAEKAAKEAEQAEKDRLKAIEDAQKAQIASYDAEINLYNSKISLSEAENGTVAERVGYYEQIKEILQEKIEYLETLGGREAEINELKVDQYEIEEKIAKLKEDEIERQQQEELAVITDEIALLESRLKIAEQTYGAETERISILVSINALLADQIQYLISIGATELEINKIKSEQLGIQAQILQLEQAALNLVADEQLGTIQNELDALLNGIELEEKSLDLTEEQVDLEKDRSEQLKKMAQMEEQIAKAKLDYINSVIDAYKKSEDSADTLADKQAAVQAAREKLEQARRDAVGKQMEAYYKKQKDANSDALDLEEKRLAVEKARVALQAAEADRSVRVYNEESGEWERQADAKKVQDAKEAFNDAVRALNDFVEEQAWDEVISAVENGSISGSRMNAILDKWAAENYGEGSPEFIAQIKSVYRQSLGSVDEDDSVIGAEKSVETAVKNLNEYLKDEAIKELKTYLATGARDQDEMKAILDKWMGLGEGTELYTWRSGLLDVVTEAIESNYYDDSKVTISIEDVSSSVKSTTTAVHGTTTAVQNLEKTFVSEIQKAAKQNSEAIALVMEKYADSVSPDLMAWAQQVLDKKTEYEEYDAYTHEKTANGMTQALIDQYMEEMKANSKEWQTADEERRKWLENRNLFLGNSLGWERDKNSGVWYDSEGKRAYDNGGVLRGLGGIKATERPEIVLDPDLTEKILRPNSEAQFRAFADALGLIFEHGDRIGSSSKPIFNGQRYSDSHNVSTVINGVPIPSHVAENYTIAELARMIPAV